MIKTEIEDKVLLNHINELDDDRREVFLLGESLRLSAVSATGLVNEMRANHKTGLVETYILAQGYIAGALLSSEVKGNDRIQLTIECGGPVKGMSIEAWACGAVRGYLVNNPIPLDNPLTSLDTSPLFGPGFLTVTKILEGSKTPFSGQIMMEYGHLAQDLSLYYTKSEQTPSIFVLSIDFDKEGRVWGAGGVMIQALPGCSESLLDKLEKLSPSLSSMGSLIGKGTGVRDWVETTFSSFSTSYLGHTPIGFSCPCSEKNFRWYLLSLPEKEKKEILASDFPLVLQCYNCGTEYKFSEEQLSKLFTEGK